MFKNKFFLDLGTGGEQQAPATIAPPAAKPAAQAKAQPADSTAPSGAEAPSPAASEAAAPPRSSQTTAEAIAAELAAAQASRPAPTLATFAPECVSAGGALPRSRRRGGADLGGFRDIARSMLSS